MTEKSKTLADAIASIEKQYGAGSIWQMDDEALEMEVIPTGCMTLDRALGVGGYPKGRIIEIYGPESSGKSTLAQHAVASAQQLDPDAICGYIDTENALDPTYAQSIGIDLDRLLISQPDTGEQGLGILQKLVETGEMPLIVVDSVAALTPRAEIEGEMGDAHVGLQARMMSQAMRKLAGVINRTDTVVIFINQLRNKIGVMYGTPEVTTGGLALPFYASMRLDVRRIEAIKDGVEVIGNKTRVKVKKNKVAPPFREAVFEIYYGQGISRLSSLLVEAVECGVMQRGGAWYKYGDIQVGQGLQNSIAFLEDNPEFADEIEAKVRVELNLA